MSDNRREFLKTLGKLGAALGITAAATTLPSKGDPTPAGNLASLEATSNPTTGTTRNPSFPDVLEKIDYKFGFTGFKPRSQGATKMAQDAINSIENLRLDNIKMRMAPPIYVEPDRFISPHLQHLNEPSMFAESVRITRQQQLLKELDPYNWGDVFDLTWDDWRTRDARHYAVEGCWTARVKARYRDLFGDVGVLRRSCCVAKEELYQHAKYAGRLPKDDSSQQRVLGYRKDAAYNQIIDEIQKAIQWFVDNREGHTFEELKNLPAPAYMSNSHISNRDKIDWDLSDITK